MKLSNEDVERFWAKVKVTGPDDCWEWQRARSTSGYGVFSIKHKWVAAHSVSFYLRHLYVPNRKAGLLIMHDCENPSCVNPKHLIEGTPKQNGNYPGCLEKFRARRGPLHPSYGKCGLDSPRYGQKHTAQTKEKLRKAAIKRGGWHRGLKRSKRTREKIRLVTQGECSGAAKITGQQALAIYQSKERQAVLAKRYSLDPSTISNIKSGRTWGHLTKLVPCHEVLQVFRTPT